MEPFLLNPIYDEDEQFPIKEIRSKTEWPYKYETVWDSSLNEVDFLTAEQIDKDAILEFETSQVKGMRLYFQYHLLYIVKVCL